VPTHDRQVLEGLGDLGLGDVARLLELGNGRSAGGQVTVGGSQGSGPLQTRRPRLDSHGVGVLHARVLERLELAPKRRKVVLEHVAVGVLVDERPAEACGGEVSRGAEG
jgi:hypothetical protein